MAGILTAPLDVERLLVGLLDPASNAAPVRNVKPEQVAPYRCSVIRADLLNRVTPLSRYCRIGVQGWAVRADGSADLAAAHNLATEVAGAIERHAGTGWLLAAQIDAGPYRVADSITGIEYAYATVLAEVLTAPVN